MSAITVYPVKKQQKPIKKNKIHLLGAYYAPGPVLSTKHDLSYGSIKTTLAQKSYDYCFTDGTLRLGVNMWGSSGLSCHSPQLGSQSLDQMENIGEQQL